MLQCVLQCVLVEGVNIVVLRLYVLHSVAVFACVVVCVVVCCGVLQYVAVCCSVLQCSLAEGG